MLLEREDRRRIDDTVKRLVVNITDDDIDKAEVKRANRHDWIEHAVWYPENLSPEITDPIAIALLRTTDAWNVEVHYTHVDVDGMRFDLSPAAAQFTREFDAGPDGTVFPARFYLTRKFEDVSATIGFEYRDAAGEIVTELPEGLPAQTTITGKSASTVDRRISEEMFWYAEDAEAADLELDRVWLIDISGAFPEDVGFFHFGEAASARAEMTVPSDAFLAEVDQVQATL